MRNKYEIIGDEVHIFLSSKKHGEQVTKISLSDLEKVKSIPYTWYAHWSPHGRKFYVVANIYTEHGKRTQIKLHRLINDPLGSELVDHINHDTLDNRRSNLRNVINRENQQNRESFNRNSTTKVRGVSYRKDINKYRARVYDNREVIFSEHFETLEEAERAIEHFRKSKFKFLNKEETA